MIPTRSASCSASSRYCVVRKTVVPSSLSARTSRHSARAARRVQAGRGLVEEQHLRAVHEREREVQAAAHAARVAADAPVGGLREPDALEQVRRARRAPSAPRRPCRAPCMRSSSRPGHQRVDRRLLQRDADRAPHGVGLARRRRGPATRAVPGGRAQQRGEDADRRSSCPRRWARGSHRSRPRATSRSSPSTARMPPLNSRTSPAPRRPARPGSRRTPPVGSASRRRAYAVAARVRRRRAPARPRGTRAPRRPRSARASPASASRRARDVLAAERALEVLEADVPAGGRAGGLVGGLEQMQEGEPRAVRGRLQGDVDGRPAPEWSRAAAARPQPSPVMTSPAQGNTSESARRAR